MYGCSWRRQMSLLYVSLEEEFLVSVWVENWPRLVLSTFISYENLRTSAFHIILRKIGSWDYLMVFLRYVIYEKASQLGGTWWENKYRGVACDIPSHFYSFSFFQNPYWTREYSTGKEIHEYLVEVNIYSYYSWLTFLKYAVMMITFAYLGRLEIWSVPKHTIQ